MRNGARGLNSDLNAVKVDGTVVNVPKGAIGGIQHAAVVQGHAFLNIGMKNPDNVEGSVKAAAGVAHKLTDIMATLAAVEAKRRLAADAAKKAAQLKASAS